MKLTLRFHTISTHCASAPVFVNEARFRAYLQTFFGATTWLVQILWQRSQGDGSCAPCAPCAPSLNYCRRFARLHVVWNSGCFDIRLCLSLSQFYLLSRELICVWFCPVVTRALSFGNVTRHLTSLPHVTSSRDASWTTDKIDVNALDILLYWVISHFSELHIQKNLDHSSICCLRSSI